MASGAEQGSFAFPSCSGISKRSGHAVPPPPPPPPRGRGRPLALHPDIDRPPTPPRPAFQLLAFALILFFAALQFLPATHFRDPADPLRRWIPFGSEPGSSSLTVRSEDGTKSKTVATDGVNFERINVVSGLNVGSSGSCCSYQFNTIKFKLVRSHMFIFAFRVPEKVHFHFLISENEEEKSSYYKLKVLFPGGNFHIIGQKEIKDRTKIAAQADEWSWPSVRDVVPVVISNIYPSLSRFIYVSPNTIMKGSVEELFGVSLGTYAIAAVEDCSRSLGSYINISILNAIQRTAAKTWVSEKPYDEDTCTPDLNVLLIDAKKLGKYLVEAFLWWNKVLDKQVSSSNGTNPSIIVTLYQKYLKLSTTWKFVSKAPQADDGIKIIGYDGEMRICSEIETENKVLSFGNVWRHYLSPKSEIILGHSN